MFVIFLYKYLCYVLKLSNGNDATIYVHSLNAEIANRQIQMHIDILIKYLKMGHQN